MKKAISSPTETSIIAKETTIKGDIDFVGNLVVEGTIESQVRGSELTVQQSGKVIGAVNVDLLNCHGTIEGDVHTKHLTMFGTAVITGKVHTSVLETAAGSMINGHITMKPKNAPAAIPNLSDQAQKKKAQKA